MGWGIKRPLAISGQPNCQARRLWLSQDKKMRQEGLICNEVGLVEMQMRCRNKLEET